MVKYVFKVDKVVICTWLTLELTVPCKSVKLSLHANPTSENPTEVIPKLLFNRSTSPLKVAELEEIAVPAKVLKYSMLPPTSV